MTDSNHKRDPEECWAEPLASQLATLRIWRRGVNVLAFVAGVSLVVGGIVWLAGIPAPARAASTPEPIHNSLSDAN